MAYEGKNTPARFVRGLRMNGAPAGVRFLGAVAVAVAAVGLASMASLSRQMPEPAGKGALRALIHRAAGAGTSDLVPGSPSRGGEGECVPGSRLLVRLTDRVDGAVRRQPDLRKAYRRIWEYWRKHPDPYSGLRRTRALARMVVSFARGDVGAYIKGIRPRSGRRRPRWLNGVSESRLSLFMPAPSTHVYRLNLVKGGKYVLIGEIGVIPWVDWGPVTFTITARTLGNVTKVLLTRQVTDQQRGIWHPVKVDLSRFAGKAVELVVETRGPPRAAAFLARPEIWKMNDCRAGPNIVLLVVDTMRADTLHALSGKWKVTPAMDRLASEGALFTRCSALASRTRPSMTAMLASEWVSRLGLSVQRDMFGRRAKWLTYGLLKPRLATLHLKRAGYRIAAIGNNFFFLGHTAIGLDRGLESVTDIRHRLLDSPAIVQKVGEFLKENNHRPFFLWVHLDGPHWPYRPPRGYAVKGARAPGAPRDRAWERYLGEIKRSDEHVALVLDRLKKLGLDGRTIVAVTADHGEIFSRLHDYRIQDHHTRHRHGWSSYDEVMHVPLILRGPGVGRGVRVGAVVSHIDLMPTLVDLAGLAPLPLARGESLVPLMQRHGSAPHTAAEKRFASRPVFFQAKLQVAVRVGRFKYIRRWGKASLLGFSGMQRVLRHELFDLEADPYEVHNLYRARPAVFARMKRLVREFFGGKAKTADFERRFFSRFPLGDVVHIRLWGGNNGRTEHRLKVSLEAASEFVLVSLSGPRSQARWPTGRRRVMHLLLRAAPGQMATASVGLPSSPARLGLELDGRPVRPRDVFAGPFGLSLLSRLTPLDTKLLGVLSARRTPVLPRTDGPRVEMWNVRSGPRVTGPPAVPPADHDEGGAREVDRLMRAWGYIRGRGPTHNNRK